MGMFDRFRERRPTPDQERRLAAITDPGLRARLLDCIRRGEPIPEFAWRPRPSLNEAQKATVADLAAELRGRATGRAMPAAEYIASMASYDSADILAKGAHRLNAGRYLLVPPRTVEPLNGVPDNDITPVFGWGIFNPFGPTVTTLDLRRLPAEGGRLLQLTMRNPFVSRDTGYAIFPEAPVVNRDTLDEALTELVTQNGSADYPLIAGDLPTHILLSPQSPISPGQIRELFFAMTRFTSPMDLAAVIARYREFAGKPWDRASAELRSAFHPRGAAPAWPPERGLWDEWWTRVTDPAHVQSEIDQMRAAWQGSIGLHGIKARES